MSTIRNALQPFFRLLDPKSFPPRDNIEFFARQAGITPPEVVLPADCFRTGSLSASAPSPVLRSLVREDTDPKSICRVILYALSYFCCLGERSDKTAAIDPPLNLIFSFCFGWVSGWAIYIIKSEAPSFKLFRLGNDGSCNLFVRYPLFGCSLLTPLQGRTPPEDPM